MHILLIDCDIDELSWEYSGCQALYWDLYMWGEKHQSHFVDEAQRGRGICSKLRSSEWTQYVCDSKPTPLATPPCSLPVGGLLLPGETQCQQCSLCYCEPQGRPDVSWPLHAHGLSFNRTQWNCNPSQLYLRPPFARPQLDHTSDVTEKIQTIRTLASNPSLTLLSQTLFPLFCRGSLLIRF